MFTFQDFLKAREKSGDTSAVLNAITQHKQSDEYKIAVDADLYDRQRNVTINNYVQTIFTIAGAPIEDYTASNNKIASNFFHRLNNQRCTYSLGNGVYFSNDKNGTLKAKLGKDFDHNLYEAAYFALIHGVSFGFWNFDKLYVFKLTEFVPLIDENTSIMRAGVRFWQLSEDKPLNATLYEEDGYTSYVTNEQGKFIASTPKTPYKLKIAVTEADGEVIIGGENYGSLPIVPLWGSKLHQSTLVGMQTAIDSFDLIRSGFANDLTDCAEIYWLIENCGGMYEEDLQKFRERLKITHIASVPEGDEAKVTPYTQEIPYQARKTYLDDIRAGIYEDFGALDVHAVDAASTNDHLEAAYQPMDENADDFEYQIIEFIQQILVIMGEEVDVPIFKRNRISNQAEQVQMVLSEAAYLDEETILNKLPNITPDEVKEILERKDFESMDRMGMMNNG